MKRTTPFLLLAAFTLSTSAACTVYVRPDDYSQPPPPPEASEPYPDQGSYDAPADSSYDQSYDDHAEVDTNTFYDELAPYGHWVDSRQYGRVWYPDHVESGWRPYSDGRWVESEYGWTWVSEERFGWATYHYGRWYEDEGFGWVWVPGRTWGPAWVTFHEGGGYVGWAPLPPSVGYRAGVGLLLNGIDLSVAIAPRAYVFVPERSFLEPRVVTYIAPRERNVTIIRNTVNITNITVVNNRIVNRGIPVTHIEQATGHRVQRFQVADAPNGAGRPAAIQGNQVQIYRPRAARSATSGVPAQPVNGPRPRANAQPVQPNQPATPRDPDTLTPGERRRQDDAQSRAAADEARRARVADDQAKAAEQANGRRDEADQQRKARIAADQQRAADQADRRRAADEQRQRAQDDQKQRTQDDANARRAQDRANNADSRAQAQRDSAAEKDKARLARIEADKAKQAEKDKAKQDAAREKAARDKEKDKPRDREDQKPPVR